MKQVLFVLKEGQIAFWKYSRGSLARGTLNGNRWNEFTPSYWDGWSEVNLAGDSVDVILLSDKPNGFDPLPDWLQERKDESAWTLSLLGKLANDDEFKGKGLVLSQGKVKFALAVGNPVETYSLSSSLKFSLPKDEPKKEVVKPEPAKPVAKPAPSGIIGDSYNDPEALKLSAGDELKGVVEKIFVALKRNYVRVDGLEQQVCFKSADAKDFTIGAEVRLTVTAVDKAAKSVLFSVWR